MCLGGAWRWNKLLLIFVLIVLLNFLCLPVNFESKFLPFPDGLVFFCCADLCSASVSLCAILSELVHLLTGGMKSSLQVFLYHSVSMNNHLSVIFCFQYRLFSVLHVSVGQTLLIG